MVKGKLRILFISLATGFVGAIGLPLAAHAATINGCSFTQTPTVWTLDANCTSTAEINITAMPTHLLPANNSTVNVHNFMFTWTTVTDPSSPVTYDWEGSYSSATTGAGGAFTGPRSATHTGLTSPEVNSPATPDNVYYWHVRAVDAAGNKSAWTDPWKVTVDTSLPPANKDQCKNNGWKRFTNPKFKNQGDCVSYVASDNKANGNPTVLFNKPTF